MSTRPTTGKMTPATLRRAVKEEETDGNLVLGDIDNPNTDYDGNMNMNMDTTEASPKATRKDRTLARNKQAVRARAKALARKFEFVESKMQTPLESDENIIVECTYFSESKIAPMNNSYDYIHLIKLRSDRPFTLVREAKVDEGLYAGHVAIIIKQSLPFPLMKLPQEVRAKILKNLLKHDEDTVAMALKHSGTKSAYSPVYSGKNNLAIIGTCKQICGESAAIVYTQYFHFPGTQVISSFLLQIGQFRQFLVKLRSDTYNSTSARTMFHLLQEARMLQLLRFTHISSNESPKTAVRNIYNDGNSWLLSLDKNNPTKGLDILEFEVSAFHMREKDKNGNVNVVQWGHGEQLEFLKGLRLKLQANARRH